MSHEDEGLPTDELESKKSELEESIVKVDTELRQMRERADRRAKLAEFNEGELEREKAAKAKKAFVSASHCSETPSRHRRDSSASHELVAGLFFEFGAVRTASSDRPASRPNSRIIETETTHFIMRWTRRASATSRRRATVSC